MAGVVVVGAGPGVGIAVAKRFAREGMRVGLVARSVKAAAEQLPEAEVQPADSTDEAQLQEALDRIVAVHGVPEVAVYNAAMIQADAIGELTARQHLEAWAVNVGGAISTAAHLLPAMAERGSGTFLVTGGMPVPKATYASLSLGKANLRTLITLLHQQYGEAGIHAAIVTIGGGVAPGSAWDPDDIADHYWRLHRQTQPEWLHELVL